MEEITLVARVRIFQDDFRAKLLGLEDRWNEMADLMEEQCNGVIEFGEVHMLPINSSSILGALQEYCLELRRQEGS